MKILVTGGAGYLGAVLVNHLLASGDDVRVVDALLHGQDDVARELEAAGAEVRRLDLRDTEGLRGSIKGADIVVHLAAIVGDPACARWPDLARSVNVDATEALLQVSIDAAVARLVFASTCSNYGRLVDPTTPVTETADLLPLSTYAEHKVAIEELLAGQPDMPTTILRFATIYGVAPRMRFDLTVNEFTRDLWAGRALEVFGHETWRPYVHVADAARAIDRVLHAPPSSVEGEVFNVGSTQENYRKSDIVDLVTRRLNRGDITYVERQVDPRDYKVSFEKIHDVLSFAPLHRVPDGIDEIIDTLERGVYGNPFEQRYSNS